MPKKKEIIVLHKPNIEPAQPGQVQIIEHGRDIHMYKITDTEINELCSGYTSIDFGLFTLCVGICLMLILSLLTTQMSDRMFATFNAIAFVAFLGIIFFGFRTRRINQRVRERAQQIKESRQI